MASITPTGSAPSATGALPPGFRHRRVPGGKSWLGWILVAPGLIGLVLFIIAPLLGSLVLGFFNYTLLGGGAFTGLANFTHLFRDPQFLNSVRVTAIFVAVYTPLNLALSLAMALWLKSWVAGKAALRVIFLIPALSPIVVNAVIFRLLLQQNGAINETLAGIGVSPIPWLSDGNWAMVAIIMVSLWQSFGYNMIILGAGLDSISPDVIAASRIDGAGPLRRLRSITLPLLSPALFFTTVLTVIGAWQVFIQVYIMTGGGPGQSTETIMMYLYATGFTFNQLGYASAIAAVLFVIIAIVTLIQLWGQKQWVHYD